LYSVGYIELFGAPAAGFQPSLVKSESAGPRESRRENALRKNVEIRAEKCFSAHAPVAPDFSLSFGFACVLIDTMEK